MRLNVPAIVQSTATVSDDFAIVRLDDRHVVHFRGIIGFLDTVWVIIKLDLPLRAEVSGRL